MTCIECQWLNYLNWKECFLSHQQRKISGEKQKGLCRGKQYYYLVYIKRTIKKYRQHWALLIERVNQVFYTLKSNGFNFVVYCKLNWEGEHWYWMQPEEYHHCAELVKWDIAKVFL